MYAFVFNYFNQSEIRQLFAAEHNSTEIFPQVQRSAYMVFNGNEIIYELLFKFFDVMLHNRVKFQA